MHRAECVSYYKKVSIMKLNKIIGIVGLALGSAASMAEDANLNLALPNSFTATYGDSLAFGNGKLKSYISKKSDGTPYAVGVEFHKSALVNTPTEHNDGLNCWDSNGDNDIDLEEECSGGHNRTLALPPNNTPFNHISVDWEPHGHVPADVYDIPHFDFHFYMISPITRNLIAVGPCFGTINCAVYEKAIVPIKDGYIHPDFFNTKLAFSRMGNHYADKTSPEFNGKTFTHTFILGSFDSKITFFEPMISMPYLKTKPNQCTPVKQPARYQANGYYPHKYCIRFNGLDETYTVSLEDFRYRQAN